LNERINPAIADRKVMLGRGSANPAYLETMCPIMRATIRKNIELNILYPVTS
jgi:hypothetical protein